MTAPLAPRDIAVLTLRQAATHSHSPSDRIAYALDAELLLHPEALAVETPAGWDHHIAQLVELNRLHAEVAAYRALELGDPDGRVSASCGNPEHPTWLRAPDDIRGCPWCRTAELENAAAATGRSLSSFIFDSDDPGADALGAQWLYHQAMPQADDPFAQPRAFRSSVLSEASKAVEEMDVPAPDEHGERPQAYLDGYSDALNDAAEGLEKRADQAAEGSEGGQVAAPQHYDKVPDPLDGCHWCACGNRWPCKRAPKAAA